MSKLAFGAMAFSAIFAATAFADVTWKQDDGDVLEYRGDLLYSWADRGNHPEDAIILRGVKIDDITLVGSTINTKGYSADDKKINSRFVGQLVPFFVTEGFAEDHQYREVQMHMVNSKDNAWGSGYPYSVVVRLEQVGEDNTDIRAYLRASTGASESSNLSSLTPNSNWRNDNWNNIGLFDYAYVADHKNGCYYSDELVYHASGMDFATPVSTKSGLGVDQLTFVRNTALGKTVEVVNVIEDDGVLKLDPGLKVVLHAATAFPDATAFVNPVYVTPGSELQIVTPPADVDSYSIEGGVFGEGGMLTVTTEDVTNRDAEFGDPTVTTGYYSNIVSRAGGYKYYTIFTNAYLNAATGVVAHALTNHRWHFNNPWIGHWRDTVDGSDPAKTFQVQFEQDNCIRCVIVYLRQNKEDIDLKIARAASITKANGGVIGLDFLDTTDPLYQFVYSLDIMSDTKEGLSLKYVRLFMDCALAAPAKVTMNCANVSSNMTLHVAGSPNGSKVRLTMGRNTQFDDFPCAGRVIIDQGGEVYIKRSAGYSTKYQGQTSQIIVKNGGWLLTADGSGQSPLGAGPNFPLVVEKGGEVVFGYGESGTSCNTYISSCTMKGGKLSGQSVLTGYRSSLNVDVVGEDPSTIDCDIRMQADNANRTANFAVNDVTKDAEADLVINGVLTDVDPADSGFTMTVRKFNAGTVLLNAPSTYKPQTRIYCGTWRLGVNDAMNAAQEVELSHTGILGTAAGTTNTIKSVAAKVDDYGESGAIGIDLGADSLLTVNDLNFTDAGAVLTITGTLGEKSLRIGRALTSAELAKIRYLAPNAEKSKRVMQDAEGYITPIVPLVIIFR